MENSNRVGPWHIYEEKFKGKPTLTIKRQIIRPNGKKSTERFPRRKYAYLLDKSEELEALVIRLNGRDVAEEKARTMHPDIWSTSFKQS